LIDAIATCRQSSREATPRGPPIEMAIRFSSSCTGWCSAPPLGLLESLARNEPVDDIRAGRAIQMADRLRHEYDKMLREHHALTVELRKLAAAAKEEAKPDQARFAEELIVHAQNEEQVLYPATLVIGDYLKLRRSSHAGQ